MTAKVEEIEAALIDTVCSRVRERVGDDEAPQVEEFVRQYYRWVPPEDLAGRSPLDVYGAALAHWNFLRKRRPGETKVRVYNPQFEQHGWQSTHTVVDVATDDMPFLVDSLSMELSRHDYGIHLLIHPVVHVTRDDDGELTKLLPAGATEPGAVAESAMHIEIDQQTEAAALDALRNDLLRVLGDVGAAVRDWRDMRDRVHDAIAELDKSPPPEIDRKDVAEAKAMLAWLEDGHFTFLGYREYELTQKNGEDHLKTKEDSGLGILRRQAAKPVSRSFAKLPPRVRALAREKRLLTLTTANSRATVHRPSYLDYIGVKRFDDQGEGLGERQRVRLFVRRDEYERFLSCLVFVPRDRFNTQIRERIGEILKEAFDGESVDFELRLSESVLARIHYIVRTGRGELGDHDIDKIEARIVDATRDWTDELRAALVDECGEDRGNGLFRRYGRAFPTGYRADWLARTAVADIRRLEALDDDGLGMSLYHPLEAPRGALRCKLLRSDAPVSLSDVLPMFENMGLKVVDERPYEVRPRDGAPAWIYDFGLSYVADEELDGDEARAGFQDAFARIWRGDVENDGFNGLVLRAGLPWHDVTILRAIARYLRQAGTPFSNRYMEQALMGHPDVARGLIELFHLRLDPARDGDRARADAAGARLEEAIDAVESLDEDRILRNFLSVIRAILRTNHYRAGTSSLAFKLDCAQIPIVPAPRPRFEIFVYSPRTEGVHLRGGSVARGGLRWSDRREGFRA